MTPLGDEAPHEDLSGSVEVSVLTEDGGRVDWSGARWVFTANLDDGTNDIYSIDAETFDGLERWTTHAYNEHAAFTPSGTRLVWMSNAGNRDRSTDWWWVRADGTGLGRLTRLEGRGVAADLSIGPDGRTFVGYVQDRVGGEAGRIVLVRLPAE